ncbi:hypothetical protein [Variovorax sp. W2I14]|uniref:hypothetical protein n=1 Tax=Variovorax sp. W2I14 TaxID=3042290 RepID=UPI003D1B4D36
MNTKSDEFPQALRGVFHQITEDILLFGPARTHSQQGAACATAGALFLLLGFGASILWSDRPLNGAVLNSIRDLATISVLILLVVVQLIFPRRFLFQRGSSFAILDRRNQCVYWALGNELVPFPRDKVHSTIGTTTERLANQLQSVHRTSAHLRASRAGDNVSVDIPVFDELDHPNHGRALAALALSILSGFMAQKPKTGRLLTSADLGDLRQQRVDGILTNLYRFVRGINDSSRSGRIWRLLLAVPFAAALSLHQVFLSAVRFTSKAPVWPEALLREIGPLHAKSALQAIISSKR